jgi:hypothetical protein
MQKQYIYFLRVKFCFPFFLVHNIVSINWHVSLVYTTEEYLSSLIPQFNTHPTALTDQLKLTNVNVIHVSLIKHFNHNPHHRM